ncbi:hypothetical protein [Brasilonema bromeliae]|uniref:Uncharacterized protein n=1 Tax=Brasilonema bromeliae SPC951 TaxID=385972 RepID=A0ABX1P2R2_9CYAN|nr:hypothetical protein [Brasilonema bromeliae]NMG18251.1 hypothetical protein [Brasilonema bromeliae SPC951]
MQARTNPLSIIINPPGIQYGMPGDIVSLYAVVINEGDQSAVIDLFFTFDETFQKISGWSASPRASLAVAPKESSDEVTFDFEIPVDALAGTYDYTFVVDSPEHYPQDTPINFPGQLKVLLKEQTVIRAFDPTFSIIPATNPNKLITYRIDQPLQVVVKVENRSNRVDRFRLTCPDLDESWFKISYPATGLEGAGLFDVSALELNPHSEGEISLEFRPPIDTLAGSYSPTIRLLSENNPDLILLDLIYINLPTNYQLGIELNTILGKVSQKDGVFELALNNQGNLIRELFFNAKTRDEEEICTYKFDPSEFKLLPNTTEKASLLVKPGPWWRRPFFGQPLPINFEVNITDKQSYPLANASPQATLLWKARPWWQFLLLILLGLGLFAGISYMIWRLLNPEPLTIESFSTDKRKITEGDEVRLNWKINNYKPNRIEKLVVVIPQLPNNGHVYFDKKNNINELTKPVKSNQYPPCNFKPQEELECNRVTTGIKNQGKYVFELQVSYLQGSPLFNRRSQTVTKTAETEITKKPIAEVVDFKVDKSQYKTGESVSVSLTIKNPQLLNKLIINKKTNNLLVGNPVTLEFQNGKFKDPKLQKCKEENNLLKCTFSLPASNPGTFTYDISAISGDQVSNKQAQNPVEILPKPFKIVFFKINNIDNSQKQSIVLNEGDQITVSWKVEGENVSVKLSLNNGDVPVPQTGNTSQIPVDVNFPRQIILTVTDKFGKLPPQPKGFLIIVKPKPTPASDLITPSPSPTQNIFKPLPASPRSRPLF